jgi:hypothetical protein
VCKMKRLNVARGLWWVWGRSGIYVHNGSKHVVVRVRVGDVLSSSPESCLDIGACGVYETPRMWTTCEVWLCYYTEEREMKSILLRDGGARSTTASFSSRPKPQTLERPRLHNP